MKKWMVPTLCALCILVSGCAPSVELTRSGSNEWSRGTIVGTTAADPVAVAAWEDTTFVVWFAEDGQLQLAQLDVALGVESTTALALSAAYPRDLQAWVEAPDRLHLAWVDTADGVPSVIYAQVAPGQSVPLTRQEIPLPDRASQIETALQLEAQRLEIFWSASHYQNDGIYHKAVSLTGDVVAAEAQLSERGWQPSVELDSSGVMHIAWPEVRVGGNVGIWYGLFDPESQSVDDLVSVAEIRLQRSHILLGPEIGFVGDQTVLGWSTGSRRVEGGFWDRHWGGGDFGGAFNPADNVADTVSSDTVQYVMVSPGATEMPALTSFAIGGKVVGYWKAPGMLTVGDRAWAVFSGWVVQRSKIWLQVVLTPFGAQGQESLTIVTDTWSPSSEPRLAAGADGSLRAAWFEAMGGDSYRVVVASSAAEAQEALGGIRLSELTGDVAGLLVDLMGLLAFAPFALGWMVLPLGVVVLGTIIGSADMRGWKPVAWLAGAILVQLGCKWYIAPSLLPLGLNPVNLLIVFGPLVLGAGLMWFYWWRAKEPVLLIAYCLFGIVEVAFALFVAMPLMLWRIG